MGRPFKGSLSTYPQKLGTAILKIRKDHPGWGAHSILLELEETYGYKPDELPGVASINRYLKQQGMVADRAKVSLLPMNDEKGCKKVRRAHDQWELDAKSAHAVEGMGYCAPINIKDRKSKVHCISFPVPVVNKNTQPSTPYYYWTLRLAFSQWGLPKSIRVDHDSVFFENSTASPFPKLIHLWLIGLGVELCFIKRKPPLENGSIERSHQIIRQQIYQGQKYKCWKDLFRYSQQRIEKLNHQLPNRMLDNQAPLKYFPKAQHSARFYSVQQEEDLIDLKKVYRYLAKGKWYRSVSVAKTVSLGGKTYYIKSATPRSQLTITFCSRRKKLLFHNVNELLIAILPLRHVDLLTLMGEDKKSRCSMYFKLKHRKNCPIST